LEKVKLEEYNSHFGLILSFICTHSVALLLKITKKIAAYIDSQHIDEVEKHILDIIKILEYKKSAINMRHQAAASEVNKELNTSEFNNSVEEEPVDAPVKKIIRSEIGNQMSKILADFDNDDPEEQVRMKGTSNSIQLNK
jgi:Na+-translocating ferredoxin:NAD+ oxidoreductase RnfG subunit